MNKYFENMNIETFVGMKFGENNRDYDYQVAAAKKDIDKLSFIIIENSESYNQNQLQIVEQLQDETLKEDYDKVLRMVCDSKNIDNSLRFVEIKIKNPLLRANNSDIYSVSTRCDIADDLLCFRIKENNFFSKDDIKKELTSKNFLNDLRKLFFKVFGDEYKKELNDYYCTLAKDNCEKNKSQDIEDEKVI